MSQQKTSSEQNENSDAQGVEDELKLSELLSNSSSESFCLNEEDKGWLGGPLIEKAN